MLIKRQNEIEAGRMKVMEYGAIISMVRGGDGVYFEIE
jgi:hypothetical protein